jgi:cytochrome oxidase Cu insertion factor (SCO1/SenC/PrrC family)
LRRDVERGPHPHTAEDYLVDHTAPVHLIDRKGRDRVVYGSTFEPKDLAEDLRRVLRLR